MNLSVYVANESTDEIYVTLEDVGDTIVPPLMSRAPLGSGSSTKEYPVQANKGTGKGLVRFVVRLDKDQDPPEFDATVPLTQEHQRIEWPLLPRP